MGAQKVRVVDMDITSYTAGGEAFGPSDVGMTRFIRVEAYVEDGTPLFARYNHSTGKLMLHGEADSADTDTLIDEAAAGETAKVRVTAYGN